MEERKTDEQQLKKKSKWFGILAAAMFFLSALFSGIGFSFFLIFGLAGVYNAFLWIYLSNQASPKKKKSFEYGRTDSSFFKNQSRNSPLKSRHAGLIVIVLVVGVLFVLLMAVLIFTSNTTTEDSVAVEVQEAENSVPEIDDYAAILKRDPNNIDALTNAGNSFYEDENNDSALYYYDRVLRLDANNSPALYNKALVYFNQKNYSAAAELVMRCVQIDPKNTDAMMLLGDCYQNQNNTDQALIQYMKAYDLGARTAALSNMLAYIYDTKGNTAKAISFYKEALEQDSSRTDVYTRLAELEPAKKAWYQKKAEEWKAK